MPHRVTLWRRRKREEALALGSEPALAADRKALKQWEKLYRKSLKNNSMDTAARALERITDLRSRLNAAPKQTVDPHDAVRDGRCPKCGERFEVRWVIKYDQPEMPQDQCATDWDLVEAQLAVEKWIALRGWRQPLEKTLHAMLTDKSSRTTDAVRLAVQVFLDVLSRDDLSITSPLALRKVGNS